MNRGLLYLAKGETFLAEAEMSAQQTEAVMPDYPIALVADREPDVACFDTVIIDEAPFEKGDKPRALQETPYDQTIYLDTDIYLSESIGGLFEILEAFELGLRRDREQAHVPRGSPIPAAFPEFNAGVMTYRSTERVMEMLKMWERRCHPGDEFDQRSLRLALYHSDVRFTPIPNRYNCQYHWDNIVDGRVKVFHGPLVERDTIGIDRHDTIDIRNAMSKLNKSDEVRLHFRWNRTLFVCPPLPLLTKVELTMREYGIRGLVAKAGKKLLDRVI